VCERAGVTPSTSPYSLAYQRTLDCLPRFFRSARRRKRVVVDTASRPSSTNHNHPGYTHNASVPLDVSVKQLSAELQTARQVLADHDRPLRRRGHETDIAKAKCTIERNPGEIESARAEHAQLTNRLSDLDRKLTRAEKLNERRPQMETQLEDIDQRLIDDRRNRSRSAATDQPGHVIDALGARPDTAKTRHAWDIAAGTLDQHHNAYNQVNGPRIGAAGHDHSKGLLANAIQVLRQAIQHEHHIANEHEGPALTRGRSTPRGTKPIMRKRPASRVGSGTPLRSVSSPPPSGRPLDTECDRSAESESSRPRLLRSWFRQKLPTSRGAPYARSGWSDSTDST